MYLKDYLHIQQKVSSFIFWFDLQFEILQEDDMDLNRK